MEYILSNARESIRPELTVKHLQYTDQLTPCISRVANWTEKYMEIWKMEPVEIRVIPQQDIFGVVEPNKYELSGNLKSGKFLFLHKHLWAFRIKHIA